MSAADKPRRHDGETTSEFAARVREWTGEPPLPQKPNLKPRDAVKPPAPSSPPPPPSNVAPAPDRSDVVIPAAKGWTPPAPEVQEAQRAAPTRPPVPAAFKHTDRTLLRLRAFELALEAGKLMRVSLGSGAELLREAEDIERWIAAAETKVKP